MADILILNISLLFAILIAPAILLVSVWYRNSLGKPVFEWPRQEMVMLTIVSAALALILLIVGISCFFTNMGYINPRGFPLIFQNRFFNFGLSCMLLITGLCFVYLALRRLLVQVVLTEGVMITRGPLPFPSRSAIVKWENVVDYFVVPDYPNTVFTLIVKESDLQYTRQSLRVPIYLKEDFQSRLEEEMGGSPSYRKDSQMEGEYSSES
jgi:small-conductance mechanosensitive channel